MRKKKVLIICYNMLHNDPRILRQIEALKNNFHIIAAGYSDPEREVDFIKLQDYEYRMIDYYFNYPWLFRKFFALMTMIYLKTESKRHAIVKKIVTSGPFKGSGYHFEKEYWTKIKKIHFGQLKNVSPDLIIANDLETLPLAAKLTKKNVKLVFDAHEYHPRELEEYQEWREKEQPRILFLCNKYMKRADLMMTVSEPIANEYEKNFNVKPILITNAPPYQELPVNPVGEKIRLVHHGGAVKQRLLEETIDTIKYLDNNYTLDLILVSSDGNEYVNSLKEKYKNESRIKFLDPVPTAQISKLINKYDIGIYILPPLNFNNINALPNKFFEFIQARLAIAIAPMEAMAGIVKKYNLGVVSEKYTSESLANEIRKLSKEQILQCKNNAADVAQELSSDKNKEIILKEIKKLLN